MEREPSRRRFLSSCCAAGVGALAARGATGTAAADRTIQEATPETRWEQTYDTGATAEANAVAPASDGGFVLAGAVEPDDGENDRELWLSKVNAGGRPVWEETFAAEGVTEGYDVIAAGNGDFVAIGHTHVPGESAQDAIALRVSGDGTEQWRRTFNARPGTTDTMRTVAVDSQGRFICGGWTSRFMDAWVARLDGSGSLDWAETLGPGNHNRFHGVVTAEEGGYVLVGETDDNSDDTVGWAVKLDEGGTQVFSQQFKKRSDSNINPYDDFNVFYDVTETRNGFVAVGANAFDPETNDRNGWALEFNVNGGKLWDRRYSQDNYTVLRSVTDGNLEYFVAGETATDANGTDARGYAANLGIEGRPQWADTWGSGSSEFSAFHLTDAEGMVCVGSQADSAGGSSEGWAVKVGGDAVATATATATPTPTPGGAETDSPSPTFSPTPAETVSGTEAAGGGGGNGGATDGAPTPTATPGGGGATQGGGTTADGDGGGLSLTTIGIGVVILALGGGGLLYNRMVTGGEDESEPDDGAGGAAATDTGDGGDGGDGVETTEPEDGNEEVQSAQTVVEGAGPDTGADEAGGDEAADAGADGDAGADDGAGSEANDAEGDASGDAESDASSDDASGDEAGDDEAGDESDSGTGGGQTG